MIVTLVMSRGRCWKVNDVFRYFPNFANKVWQLSKLGLRVNTNGTYLLPCSLYIVKVHLDWWYYQILSAVDKIVRVIEEFLFSLCRHSIICEAISFILCNESERWETFIKKSIENSLFFFAYKNWQRTRK